MPIFEYKCADCGKEFEELVLGSTTEVTCPQCKSTNTGKLMSTCRHKSAGGGADFGSPSSGSTSSGGGCAGCSGGSCATCH